MLHKINLLIFNINKSFMTFDKSIQLVFSKNTNVSYLKGYSLQYLSTHTQNYSILHLHLTKSGLLQVS